MDWLATWTVNLIIPEKKRKKNARFFPFFSATENDKIRRNNFLKKENLKFEIRNWLEKNKEISFSGDSEYTRKEWELVNHSLTWKITKAMLSIILVSHSTVFRGNFIFRRG